MYMNVYIYTYKYVVAFEIINNNVNSMKLFYFDDE